MKTAFILHCRNKARYVRAAVRSMLCQKTAKPIEILLSDSGSEDGSLQILEEEARLYAGPHTVRVLQCPSAQAPGMGGLNLHINWTMTQTDADVVCQLSADDYALQGRVQRVVEAFTEHKPNMVLTGMYYVKEETCEYLGESPYPEADSWCNIEDMYTKFVGGSASQSWTHEFFDRMGGLESIGSQDIQMPFIATVAPGGCYYLHERLHAYRKVADLANTGLEGILNAIPEDKVAERLQLEELIHFQVLTGHFIVLRKLAAMGIQSEAAQHALIQAVLDRATGWSWARERMTLAGVPPIPFKV